MNIRVANNKLPGLTTFYVPSRSEPGVEHTCQYIRRGKRREWLCTCKDFTYNCWPLGTHCDHLEQLVRLSKQYGGVRALAEVVRTRLVAA